MLLNTVYTNALIATLSQVPTWSLKIAIIMIICNLICIGIGRYAIQVRGLGPSVPLVGLEGFGLPELHPFRSPRRLPRVVLPGGVMQLRFTLQLVRRCVTRWLSMVARCIQAFLRLE